jgi:hypothetical protein
VSPVARAILLGLADLFALFGSLLALAASLAPGAELSGLQPEAASRTAYLLAGAAALFASVVLFAVARREEAEVEGDSVGW